MTKEEIYEGEFGALAFKPAGTVKQCALAAMDIWGYQQAIAFDKWKLRNHWLWNNVRMVYFKFDDEGEKQFTIEELYAQFIEQQNK